MPTLISNGGIDDRKCGDQPKVKRLYEFLRIAKLNHFEVYTVRRLGGLSPNPWNSNDLVCGKCTAVVRFRANRPISIVSYGFFGPHESGAQGKYHVDIELLTENYCPIASTSQVTPVVREPRKYFKSILKIRFQFYLVHGPTNEPKSETLLLLARPVWGLY